MPRVIHFEIPADEPERAVKFYKRVFDWEMDRFSPMEYWLATTGKEPEPGIDGAIMRRSDDKGVKNTIGVANLEEYMEKVIASGGKVITPKMPVQGVGWLVYCEDTEGNVFGMMQSDPGAK